MQQLLLLSLVSVSSSLKCKDITIGEIGGTSFNFVNTLKCPPETKWCMNVNVSINSFFSINGLFGNCETNGLIKPLLNFTTVFGDISCKNILPVKLGIVIFMFNLLPVSDCAVLQKKYNRNKLRKRPRRTRNRALFAYEKSKTAGCESFPVINVTRCCCNTDLCNSSSEFPILFTIFVPFLIKLLL